MPLGTRPTQLCSGSKFAPRTRGSKSNRNWLIRSCARRSVARTSIVPSPPPLLDRSVEFCTNDRVVNRIEPIAPDTRAVHLGMSALGQERTHAAQQKGSLFDQPVGEREKIRRDSEAERFGGCHVDDEIDLTCQLNRHIGGCRPLCNWATVDARPTIGIGLA